MNDKHEYFVDGVYTPNVTSIISDIIGYPVNASENDLIKGSAVHKCAEYIAQGKTFTWDQRIDGHVKAIFKFFEEIKPKVKFAELPVYSHFYKYAGTLDLVFTYKGWNTLFDYKNSYDKVRLGLQLAAYANALWETQKIRVLKGYGIVLNKNGRYKFTDEYDLTGNLLADFLAIRRSYYLKHNK